ncbi:MAG TPA: type IV toxin-antitoxin system AbiEi family antitoxin [Candidatus Methanoperedens sp.]
MQNAVKISTNYIIRSLFEQEYYYFTVRELAGLLKIPIVKTYGIVARLEGRGFIKSVESALNFYGFTEQVPVMVFLASTRKKKEVEFNNFRFKYVLINPEKFFGYKKERIGDLDFLIAEEEKAIIDSLYLPENAGGMAEVIKAVYNAKEKVDPDKLFAYASAMKNKSLCSRLGYLLERFEKEAGMLLECSSNEYVKLDPAREKSSVWDKKWHVNVNLREEEMLGWRET